MGEREFYGLMGWWHVGVTSEKCVLVCVGVSKYWVGFKIGREKRDM